MAGNVIPMAVGQPLSTSGQGLVGVMGPMQLQAEAEANAKRAADAAQSQPAVQGLAGHVRKTFSSCEIAKRDTIEERLLQCVRQRRGEYDPVVLAEIRKQGGSEIYMMLTANKCRSAAAWIKDVMFSTNEQAPWDIAPTREPELSPAMTPALTQQASQEAMRVEQEIGMEMMTPERMKDIVARIKDEMTIQVKDRSETIIGRTRNKMEDQLQEGGYYQALDQFIDDLVTFPYAVMKGPVPRRRKKLAWTPAPGGHYNPDITEGIQLEWERVDPFMIYWAPHCTHINDGAMIERHKMTRDDLQALLGVEGFSDDAIRGVLEDYGRGGLNNWLFVDSAKAQAEGKSQAEIMTSVDPTIDALQYWGNVQGKQLVEWGMDKAMVPDEALDYPCEVWVIGSWCIKAVINVDPLGRKPYYKTAYEVIPGSWAGNGVADLSRDCQAMCNAAARALSNNLGIASGPQVSVNVNRLPPGTDITQMYPWQIWQTTSDPYGSTADAIKFFQPQSNAQELMQIYEKFSVLADEYSGVPRYMTGDSPAGGAGRTASGMSMLMNNAGKSIKAVIGNIDMDITGPLIERLYYFNMRFSDDPFLKGDLRVVARGVNVLVAKESAQVRMNEILAIVSANPMFVEIVGEEAIADLLREVTKPLNMNIVPDKEVIRARVLRKEQAAMMQQLMQQRMMLMQAQGDEQIDFNRDSNGALTGARVSGKKTMPGNKQRLLNDAPITDNFAPARLPGPK